MNAPRTMNDSVPGSKDIVASSLLAFIAAAILVFAGCKGRTVENKEGTGGDKPSTESLDAARETLARQADLDSCRAAVGQLNTHLDRFPDERPAPPGKAAEDLLVRRFGVEADELAEVQSATFTLLDVHHLAQCFLLRDAARGLRVPGKPVAQAALAFDWTCRQVRLIEHGEPPAPPYFVLRRGWGSAYERDLVFLGLLEQLDLTGAILACNQGRFLAALVDGEQLYLFDSRLGLPVPGPDGVATLAQVKKDAGVLTRLTIDPKSPYDLTADGLAAATLYPACTLSSFAPRLRLLEDKLHSDNRVKLAGDAAASASKLDQAAKQHELKIGAWNAGSLHAPVRVLRASLPPTEGGADKRRPLTLRDLPGFAPQRASFDRYDVFRRELFELERVPWTSFPELMREQPPGVKLGMLVRSVYQQVSMGWLAPPRELILRGRYDEASPMLVTFRDQVAQVREGGDARELFDKVRGWIEQARTAQAELLNAQKKNAGVAEAEQRFDVLWKEGSKPVVTLLRQAVGPAADAELVYLLALCKHEQALQLQARLGNQQAQQAWQTALEWWDTFAGFEHHPARGHAQRMHAAALAAVGQHERATALLNTPAPGAPPLESTARLILARQK